MDIEHVRQFLDGYDRGNQYFDLPESELPDWLRDRVPNEQGADVTPFDEYDFKSRTSPGMDIDSDNTVTAVERREEKEQIWTEATEEEGFEAYAWYVPFHFSPRRFGIYVREEGLQLLSHLLYAWNYDPDVLHLAQLNTGIATSTPPDDLPTFSEFHEAARLALEILLRHEWYHHQVELMTAYLEDAQEKMLYEEYHTEMYEDQFPDGDCIEEALANAYVFNSRACANRAPSQDVFRLLFHLSTESQPSAYRAYHTVLGDEFRDRGGQLAKAIVTQDSSVLESHLCGSPEILHLGQRLPLDTNLHSQLGRTGVPLYVIGSNRTPQSIAYFDVVQLETDYEITTTSQWEDSYAEADGTLTQYADNVAEKLESNVNHSGFNWRRCRGDLQYARMNEQFRFVVRRDDDEKSIELVDFGDHELPTEYRCY